MIPHLFACFKYMQYIKNSLHYKNSLVYMF